MSDPFLPQFEALCHSIWRTTEEGKAELAAYERRRVRLRESLRELRHAWEKE